MIMRHQDAGDSELLQTFFDRVQVKPISGQIFHTPKLAVYTPNSKSLHPSKETPESVQRPTRKSNHADLRKGGISSFTQPRPNFFIHKTRCSTDLTRTQVCAASEAQLSQVSELHVLITLFLSTLILDIITAHLENVNMIQRLESYSRSTNPIMGEGILFHRN